MRINLYFVITLGLIGHILSVDAQNTGSRSEGYKAFGTITRQLNSNNTLDLTKVKGSPYANENFLPGQIFFREKNIKIDANLRYNVFNDEFEVKEDVQSENISAMIKSSDLEVFLANKRYILRPYTEKGTEKEGYFSVISEGHGLGVYERKTKVFTEGKKASNSFQIDFPPSFSDESELYYDQNSTMLAYPKNKRDLLILCSDHEEEVSNFIKKAKLNTKSTEDLMKIIQYYNSLK
ncbi:MAG: hypothetical protein WBN16_00045 [Lutimonas sp.]